MKDQEIAYENVYVSVLLYLRVFIVDVDVFSSLKQISLRHTQFNIVNLKVA